MTFKHKYCYNKNAIKRKLRSVWLDFNPIQIHSQSILNERKKIDMPNIWLKIFVFA